MKTSAALRRMAIVAITASLSLSAMPAAQAKGSPDHMLGNSRIFNAVPADNWNRFDGNTNVTSDPNPDFDIQSTWPEGSPSYHGSNGG